MPVPARNNCRTCSFLYCCGTRRHNYCTVIGTFAMTLGNIITTARIATGLTFGASHPLWGQIFITRRCNLRCPFCAAPRHTARDMEFSQWRSILDRMHDWGVRWLNVVGGEPTLYADLWRFLSYAAQKGFLTVLHSNLHSPRPDFLERITDSGVLALEVSFDSIDGSMPKSNWQNLDLLDQVRCRGIMPLACSVITSKNSEQIPEIADRITARKIMYIAAVYQHVGGLFSDNDLTLIPSPSSLHKVLTHLRLLKQSTGLVRNSERFLAAEFLHREPRWHCDEHEDAWVTVDSDGYLMACQEHKTNIHAMQVERLSDFNWRTQKARLAGGCRGCSYHCYYEAEAVKGWNAAREIAACIRAYLNGFSRDVLTAPPLDIASNVPVTDGVARSLVSIESVYTAAQPIVPLSSNRSEYNGASATLPEART